MHLRALLLLVCSASISLAADPSPAPNRGFDQKLFGGMKWRQVGPFRGGRATSIAGVVDEPNTYYFGAASGGVWKTIDGGANWFPIFDKESNATIGAIAVAPSDHNIVYVGTGEPNMRGNVTWGSGVYKSLDAGKTWKNIGLKDSRQIGAIVVDPKNADIALIAAFGHAFGPNQERGVFRTTDGGKTWTKTLFKDENTGAIDLAADPHNPTVIFAAMWQARRQPWNFSSGGPGSGLYRSEDGGVTWKQLTGNGLPDGILGRIGITVSGADSDRVYAIIENKDGGGIYRSEDGGEKWTRVNDDGRFRQRAWYFSKIYADPKSPDTVYVLNTGAFKSVDGGKTFNLLPARHGDHHGLWIDPENPNRIGNASDGGAIVSLDGGKSWTTNGNQPTAQFYHVAVDNAFPYHIYGAQQDNSNVRIASRTDSGIIEQRDWSHAGGGECGFVLADPRDPNLIYSNSEGFIVRYDKSREQFQDMSVVPLDNSGHGASDIPHRFQWVTPLFISPHDPDTLYTAAEVVFKSNDSGRSWKQISADLTRNDKTKQQPSGGPIQLDITSVEYYDTVFALAESPKQKGMIWAGTDDGLVQLTTDDGAHWANVSPKMPEWSTVDLIEASPHDANAAYIAVDRHKLDDIKPYIFKTADAGKTWSAIVNGLPEGAVVHAVREDPKRRGLLYAGTELGVFMSLDDGANWQPLQMNLPSVPVHDLVVKDDDLVAGTHGRAFWVLDDVTPLRQLNAQEAGKSGFQPDSADRASSLSAKSGQAGSPPAETGKMPVFRGTEDVILYQPQTALLLNYPTEFDKRQPVGENPPPGAVIDYYFKAAPKDEVTMDILDSQGRLVRHLSSKEKKDNEQPEEWPDRVKPAKTIPVDEGMNRFAWDLRCEDPVQTPGAFYSGDGPRGPKVMPGDYQVKLTAGGKTQTALLHIVMDPRVQAAPEALQAQFDLNMQTRDRISQLHTAINEIRDVKAQLHELHKKFGEDARVKPVLAQADDLDKQMSAVESQLIQVNMKSSEGNLVFPNMLNERFDSFSHAIDGANAAPTQPQQDVYKMLTGQLDEQLQKWAQLKSDAVPNVANAIKQLDLPALSVEKKVETKTPLP